MKKTAPEIRCYQLESFLIIHWRLQSPLITSSIQIWLGKLELPKPFLVVSLNNKQELLIIVNAKNITLTAKRFTILIQNAKDNSVIERIANKSVLKFNANTLSDFPVREQGKISNAFLYKSQELFGSMVQQDHFALAKLLAYRNVDVSQINEHELFVHFPLETLLDQSLVQAELFEISDNETIPNQISTVLVLPDSLNFLMTHHSETTSDSRCYLLKIAQLGVFPFSISTIQNSPLSDAIQRQNLARDHQSTLITLFSELTSKRLAAYTKQIAPPVKPEFMGQVEGMRDGLIKGWAVNKQDAGQPVLVDIFVNAKKYTEVIAAQSAVALELRHNVGQYAFSWAIDEHLLTGEPYEIRCYYSGTDIEVPSGALWLGKTHFSCDIVIEKGSILHASVRENFKGLSRYRVEVLLDDQVIEHFDFETLTPEKIILVLPTLVFDAKSHILLFKVYTPDQICVYTNQFKIQHRYQGAIDHSSAEKITGWFVNANFQDLPVPIEAVINRQHRRQTLANQERPGVKQLHHLSTSKVGFSFDIADIYHQEGAVSIELFVAGTEYSITSKRTLYIAKDTVLRSLSNIAEWLKAPSEVSEQAGVHLSSTLPISLEANEWVIKQIIAPAIKRIRESQGLPESIQLPLMESIPLATLAHSNTIDVIVPVYKGYDETLQCLQSILSAKSDQNYSLIVINDQSPEGRLKHSLQALAHEHKFMLIENQQNQGFVKTANLGMHLHPDRDIVLLNADTEVCDYWLDRLVAAANSSKNIGTVTPFSNNATICSFPHFNRDNNLPENLSLPQLDQLFAQKNHQKVVDLPTAVGFCMYIKRQTLNEVGYFDEKWGKGYAEENDFCLRASTQGWRHVLACDVFVRHLGSVSFGTEKSSQLNNNLKKLNQLYPDYASTIQCFIKRDPVAIFRNRIIKQILAQSNQSYLLFIIHNLGGGAKLHCEELANTLITQGHPVLELTVTGDNWCLEVLNQPYKLIYHYPNDSAQLLEDLKALNVWRIHYHQTLDFPTLIYALPNQLGVPYDFSAHDFMPICPRITMIDETGAYCDQAQFDAKNCTRCIQINGFEAHVDLTEKYQQFGSSVYTWRKAYQQFLADAEHIFTPSKITADIYRKHFQLKNITIKAHAEAAFDIIPAMFESEEGKTLQIAVIGAIGEHKGFNILLACAKNALKQGLPIEFIIFGFTCNDQAFDHLPNVKITGAYQHEDLKDLINQYHCRIALFLSVWPETFSYTLSEAWKSGLYPLAFDIGVFSERIAEVGIGQVIPYTTDPVVINQSLMQVSKRKINQTTIPYLGTQYPDIINDYYETKQ